MIVVADSSPINILVRIECIDLLPRLFGSVSIPTEVQAELIDPRTPQSVRGFVANPPPWLTVRSPQKVDRIPPLDRGEEAAISLARELRADALLIDERDGRRAAMALGIPVLGTVGVLDVAADRKLIDLNAVTARLQASDFRLSPALLASLLDRRGRNP